MNAPEYKKYYDCDLKILKEKLKEEQPHVQNYDILNNILYIRRPDKFVPTLIKCKNCRNMIDAWHSS